MPTLARVSEPTTIEHQETESLFISQSLGYGLLSTQNKDFIQFVYTGLDTNTELDTISIPKRLSEDTDSSYQDLMFGGAIAGILVFLGIGAIIGACMSGGKKTEIYEMA